jgi:phosphate transport system substrate-binding protein
MRPRPYLAVLAAGTLAIGAAACGDDTSGAGGSTEPSGGSAAASTTQDLSGQLSGAGSSAQDAAQRAWAAGFQEQAPNVTVSYDPVGSGGGREQFIQGGVAFAGSDAALDEDELADAKKRCTDVVEVPAYVSPIAVVYNLQGVTDLQLSPQVIAGIFLGQITNWNAPEIAADNPGKTLPDQAITPVHRSDDSGTTQNFTDYLNKASGGTWSAPAAGTWPVQGGEAAQGTSGVINTVTGTAGAIGYADESQAGSLGKTLVKVGDAYTGPTPEAAANVLAESKRVDGRGASSFAYDLARDTTAAGTYPIVLVSYQIACSKYADAAQADLVKGFLTYTTSADGQQVAAQQAGSAPLPDALRSQIAPAISGITAGA